MARNTTITREVVFEAADRLAEQLGKTPTQAQVRDALGGGSFTTIGPLVKEWELARSEQIDARETDVPEAVQAALAEVAGRLWKVASSEAALGVEAARRELEDMRRDAAAEEASASEAIRILEAERDAALGNVESLAADLSATRADLLQVQGDLRHQSEARVRAETHAEAEKARADRADADRKAAVDDRAKVETDATQLREAVASLREKVAELTAQAAGLSEQLVASRAAEAAADARANKAEGRADRAEARVETFQEDLKKTADDLGGARADLAKERAEHEATRNKLHDLLERSSVDLDNALDRIKQLELEGSQE